MESKKKTSRHQPNSPRTRSLVDIATDSIGRQIVEFSYPPNTLLPTESEIAASLGVGRNVVREATKILTSKGLLRITQGSGTKVQPEERWNYLDQQVINWAMESPNLRDGLIDELATLRFIVEPEVAALAAERASTTEVLRLFEAYEEMEKHCDSPEKSVEADILFHRRLFAAAHNKFLTALLQTVVAVLRANFLLAIKADYAMVGFLEEHRLVAEAVNDKDPQRARSIMQTLLENNKQHVIEMRQAIALKDRKRASAGGS
ncbi:MAG: FadR/GntR family transcriptional regulator [Pseudomonadota bacterium]